MTFEKVRGMLAEQLQADEASITLDTRLVEDLKADSANVMVMILELESEFGITVPDEDVMSLKTVRSVAEYLESHT